MGEEIESHDIASTYDRIKQIRDNIHDENKYRRTKKAILLHMRDNIKIIVEECSVIPCIEYKCTQCD